MCACSDHVPRLHDFTLRFTPRFCELMHDVDVEVAAAGLRLLALLVEHGIIKHQVQRSNVLEVGTHQVLHCSRLLVFLLCFMHLGTALFGACSDLCTNDRF